MRTAFSALADVLAQVASVVDALSARDYTAAGPAGVSGSVGQHVRHCLDHVAALERALETRHLDYDARHRGGAVEHDPQTAVAALHAAEARFRALDDRWLTVTVRVRTQLTPDGLSVDAISTVGRELAFVLSHTIHHNATVGVLLARSGRTTPRRFGYAPSTPCVRSA